MLTLRHPMATLICAVSTLLLTNSILAAPFIVADGQPNAVIVTAEAPARMTRYAAEDLRDTIEKISGARLEIVTEPPDAPIIKILVGESPHTARLGINAEGLEHGAFRMVSGPDFLALVGDDFDYEPPEVGSRNAGDRDRAQALWDEMSGGVWNNPLGNLWRFHNRHTGTWFHDRGGSYNAVSEFLHMLGVRWYMPGDLGEVVPTLDAISLPEIDRTVRPDAAVRRWFGAYMAFTEETVRWDWRLGMNSGHKVLGAGMHVHGMRLIHGRKEFQEANPEFFALYGGKRDTGFRGTGHACFSSEGLVQETVRFAQAIFDHLDEPAVSVWPQDGFRQCQCPECWEMTPSANTWHFTERVARELYKTHPDRWVSNGAYGAYRYPPDCIETFSPNVLVFLSAPRPGLDQDENWEQRQKLIDAWISRTGPGRLIRNANTYFDTVIHPRSYAREFRYTRDLSLGDWNEVRRRAVARGTVAWQTPGIDHLNQYVNARLLWDANLDLDALFEEYYRLFYGPAADAMQTAFAYAEANYTRVGRARFPTERRIRFRELIKDAKGVAGDTVHGRRIQLILDEMPSLEDLRTQHEAETLARQRPDAPLAVGRDVDAPEAPEAYRLVEIVTGEAADVKTTFTVRWDDGTLIFDIVCHEPDMENLFVSRDIWGGDSVAILMESPSHSYYQIELNPDGEVFDADRQHGPVRAAWDSRIDVETERGADFWRVLARFPVVPEAEGVLDPNNFVVGDKPGPEAPWFFNVGRVRIRGGDKTAYTFSPTGGTYHNVNRFGRLEIH